MMGGLQTILTLLRESRENVICLRIFQTDVPQFDVLSRRSKHQYIDMVKGEQTHTHTHHQPTNQTLIVTGSLVHQQNLQVQICKPNGRLHINRHNIQSGRIVFLRCVEGQRRQLHSYLASKLICKRTVGKSGRRGLAHHAEKNSHGIFDEAYVRRELEIPPPSEEGSCCRCCCRVANTSGGKRFCTLFSTICLAVLFVLFHPEQHDVIIRYMERIVNPASRTILAVSKVKKSPCGQT